MLRQSFDKSDAERPHVFLGRNRRGLHFWRVINVAAAEKLALLADGKHGIAGKFQAVVSGENVRGFHVAVDEAFAMKVDKDVEGGVENVAHFFRSKGALRQDLAEIFLGILHDRVNEGQIFEAAAPGIENGQQVGMSEMSGPLPEAELSFGSR